MPGHTLPSSSLHINPGETGFPLSPSVSTGRRWQRLRCGEKMNSEADWPPRQRGHQEGRLGGGRRTWGSTLPHLMLGSSGFSYSFCTWARSEPVSLLFASTRDTPLRPPITPSILHLFLTPNCPASFNLMPLLPGNLLFLSGIRFGPSLPFPSLVPEPISNKTFACGVIIPHPPFFFLVWFST